MKYSIFFNFLPVSTKSDSTHSLDGGAPEER